MVILQTSKQFMDDIFDWLTRKGYLWQSGDNPHHLRNQYLSSFNYKINDWEIDKDFALILDNKARLLGFSAVRCLVPSNGIRMTDKEFLENLIGDMLIVNKGEI